MDSMTIKRNMFGSDEQTYRPNKHQGSNRAKLCHIQSQKWVCLTDFFTD